MLTTERPIHPLIRRLCDVAGDGHQQDIARRLRITQSYWSYLRHGQRPLTLRVVQAIRREYPELEADAIAALLTLGVTRGAGG